MIPLNTRRSITKSEHELFRENVNLGKTTKIIMLTDVRKLSNELWEIYSNILK